MTRTVQDWLGRRARRAGTTLATAMALVAVVTLVATFATAKTQTAPATAVPPVGPTPTLSFANSGFDAGSYVNTVAVDPAGSGLVLAGSDVGGIFRSTDWGRTFRASNTGINIGWIAISSIVFSPTTPNKVYATVGLNGTGGLVVSTDGGQTWTVQSTYPRFHAGDGRMGRTTGNLVAVDAANALLYVATWDQGVLRSADDGRTWTAIGLAGADLRGIALDPTNPDVLYVGTSNAGVYKATAARGAGSFVASSGSPTDSEELLVLGSDLYVAGAFAGVYVSRDGATTWARLGGSTLPASGPGFVSIDGVRDASGATTLYAGVARPAATATGADSVYRSTDDGATWTSLTGSAQVHNTIGGADGGAWWLWARHRPQALGGASFIAAQIAVARTDPSKVFVTGNVDVWGTTDAGSNWYPMVRGLGTTVNRAVVTDPNVAGRVYAATADWVFEYSKDGFAHVVESPPPVTAPAGAQSLALDTATVPSTVYVGVGHRDSNANGDLFSNPDPANGGTWTNEGLGAATGGKRVYAVAVRRVNGTRVILAAVEAGGVWRKSGTGGWTKAAGNAMAGAQGSRAASMVWPASSSTVYLYDRASGVYRSNDNGSSWSQIWAKPSNWDMTGYVATAPSSPSTLFVSVGLDSVYRLSNATSGTVGNGITATRVGTFTSPGALATGADGRLFVTEVVTGSVTPRIATSGDNGASWVNLTDAGYRAAALFPTGLAVGSDGTVYVPLRGSGVLTGTPVPAP